MRLSIVVVVGGVIVVVWLLLSLSLSIFSPGLVRTIRTTTTITITTVQLTETECGKIESFYCCCGG